MRKYGSVTRGLGVASAILAGAMVVHRVEAQAQTAEATPLERIEVTGTNIRRTDTEPVTNVQVITSQQIEQSGQVTVADYLRTISSTFGNNSNESFANSFAPGAATVGLRGLSQKDTLVLLNGRRITNYGFFNNLSDSLVDLNVIPVSAVERIDIQKSGGAAVYGSDAIAGVINIILKENTTEKAVQGGARWTTEGGATTRDADVVYGIGDLQADKYNAVFTASAYRRDQLLFSERDNTKSQDYRNLVDGVLNYQLANQYGKIATTTPALGRAPFPTCGTNGVAGTVTTGTAGLGCYYNNAGYLPLSPSADRANLTGVGNLKLNDEWTAFADVFYSNEKTKSNFTPQTLNSSPWVYNPANGLITLLSNVLPASNPAARINPGTGLTVATPINYNFQTVGPRDETTISNTYRVSGGVKGSFMGWDVDASYGHSENHVSSSTMNGVNALAMEQEMQDGSFSFLNPLSTPGAANALRVNYGNSGVAKLDTLGLKGSGNLLNLPAGPLTAAVGGEFRRESVDDEAGSALKQGLVLRTGVTTIIASRNIEAGFAEFDVPILKGLDFDVAGREEHYGGTGSNFSPQATLRYQPVKEFTFRAVASRGFRAPDLAEASHSNSVANQGVFDPFDPQGRPSETVGYITGGNPKVHPETSKNLDIGMIFSPLKNVNLSVDYYSIWLYSIISAPTAQSVIFACQAQFGVPVSSCSPSAFPGATLVRGADNTAGYVSAPYENQFGLRTSGVDFAGDVTFQLPDASKLKFALDATYVSTFLINSGGGVWTDYVGTNGWDYDSPINGGGPVPRWRGNISATWQNRLWTAQVTGRYYDRYLNALGTQFPGGFLNQTNVSAFSAVDLYGEYRFLKHWKAMLTVVNVADAKPPYDSANLQFGVIPMPYDLFTYDDFGRMIDLHVQYTF